MNKEIKFSEDYKGKPLTILYKPIKIDDEKVKPITFNGYEIIVEYNNKTLRKIKLGLHDERPNGKKVDIFNILFDTEVTSMIENPSNVFDIVHFLESDEKYIFKDNEFYSNNNYSIYDNFSINSYDNPVYIEDEKISYLSIFNKENIDDFIKVYKEYIPDIECKIYYSNDNKRFAIYNVFNFDTHEILLLENKCVDKEIEDFINICLNNLNLEDI